MNNTARPERYAVPAQTPQNEVQREQALSTIRLNRRAFRREVGGLAFVRLYFYTSADPDAVQARLDAVTKSVRYELAARLNQKYTPEIKFTYDDTMDRANRIEELLKNL